MPPRNSPQGSTSVAVSVLQEILSPLECGFTFRLWDGTEVPVGREIRPFTVVIHSPEALRSLMRNPTALAFGEAYINGRIDIEGDLFGAVEVAECLDRLEIPFHRRLAAGFRMMRISE